MDDLILRVLTGAATPFEVERLKRWREESPHNEEVFQDLASVWALTSPEPVPPAATPPDPEAIVARARSLPGLPTPHPIRPWRLVSPRGWGLLAAGVATLALGVQLMQAAGSRPQAIYEAPPGQTLTVSLSDGSFVRLAQGSRLREWERGDRREVALEGRGFFAVARDVTRPFIVRAGAGRVQVLGTRFEIREEGEATRTVVVEGVVAVSNEQGAVEVRAGQVALAQPGAPPSAVTASDVYALLDWPEGTLVFQGTALAQVAEEVSRTFGRPLAVEGGEMASRRITAWFQGESFEEVAESLCLAAGALCRVEGDGMVLRAPPDAGGER